MTFEDWVEKYKPVVNTSKTATTPGTDEGLFGFETYGKDLAKVQSTTPRLVWTLIEGEEEDEDGDTVWVIIPGMHLVNRIAYCITQEPWGDEEIEVIF